MFLKFFSGRVYDHQFGVESKGATRLLQKTNGRFSKTKNKVR